MKWIKYNILQNTINTGTEQSPIYEDILLEKKVGYSAENLALAQNEAYNGSYVIEEDSEDYNLQPLSIELGGTGAKTKAQAAENLGGIQTYTHTAGKLTGSGTNGKFKATVDEIVTSLTVNGSTCYVKCGSKAEMKLIKDCWYTFIRDGNVVNFNSGGADIELSFEVVTGTSSPASPKENMLWVNTSIPFKNYQFSKEAPTTRADGSALQNGDLWLLEKESKEAKPIEIFKDDNISITKNVAAVAQWLGVWKSLEAKKFESGGWSTLGYTFYNYESKRTFGPMNFSGFGRYGADLLVNYDSDWNGISIFSGDKTGIGTIAVATRPIDSTDFYNVEFVDSLKINTSAFNKMFVKFAYCNIDAKDSSRGCYVGLAAQDAFEYGFTLDKGRVKLENSNSEKVYEVDISSYNGEAYFAILCDFATVTLYLTEIWFE